MQYVYFDKIKKRYFAQLKKPSDVQSVLGTKPFKHTFPQSVDRKTANRLSIAIVEEWENEIAAARARITKTEEPARPRSGPFVVISQTVTTMRRPGEPFDLSGGGHLISGRRGEARDTTRAAKGGRADDGGSYRAVADQARRRSAEAAGDQHPRVEDGESSSPGPGSRTT